MRLIAILSLASLSACATIVAGTNQVVSVTTTPPGAACTIDRGGEALGVIQSTPGMLEVGKSIRSLTVSCTKPGYQSAAATRSSSFNGWTFGNLILGGAIGLVVDVSTGANFDYPRMVDIPMAVDPAAVPAASTPRVAALQPDALIPTPNRALLTTRMMDLPDRTRAKQSFLLGACSAGDETACILAEPGPRARYRRVSSLN